MFRQVQLKFFAIITSILLAVFIVVLASINLIMEAVMQRQSQVVLNQIAAGVEYDDKTSTFTFTPADGGKKNNEHDNAPPVDSEEKTTDSSYDDSSTAAEETTASSTENTENPTEDESSVSASEQPETSYSQTDTNVQTTSPSGSQPSDGKQTTTQPNTPAAPGEDVPHEDFPPERQDWDMPPDDRPRNDKYDRWEQPQEYEGDYCYPMPDDYWKWYYGENPSIYNEEIVPYDGDTAPQEGELIQTVNYGSGGILDGYTVLSVSEKNYASTEQIQEQKAAPVPKSLGSIDFFIIMADSDGKFLAAMNNDELDVEVAQQYISAIMDENVSSGMVNNLQFCRSSKKNGTLMVFTDKQAELDMLDQLNRTTILIGIVSFVLLSVLAFFFSKKSIEPIKIAFEKQKQFVSDASHELKTPLTVISANADVLSGEIGENKWLNYIKAQTERMNVLVNDLLNLTRLENNSSDFIRLDFNLSQAITNTALPFECQAFETNKIFDVDVDEGIYVNGSERHIKQMAAIFIDNALKYSNDGGTVCVKLKKQGEKSILSVFNTGSGVKESEKDKIFERFYRSDDSRSRMTGGYGLGLAIAKSIIEKHKFKLTVDNHEGESICFNVIM